MPIMGAVKMNKTKINSLERVLKKLAYPMDDRFKNIIKKEAKRRKVDIAEMLDYYAENIEELIDLLEKSPEAFGIVTKFKKLPVKFKKHYVSAELVKLSQNLFETQKLNKKGRDTVNIDFAEGEMEVEVWEGRNTNYYIKISDLPELEGKPPKVYVSQLKNFYLLMALIQEQQYNNSVKEAKCKFTLSYYAKRRGFTEERIKKSGKFFNELKRDLISGAYTKYKIDKLKIDGKFYEWLGSLYGLGKPHNPKGDWIVSFNYPYSKMIISVLEGEARPYFVKNPKAIEDRTTDNKPYLFLFYIRLTKRKQKILTTMPIKIKNLLEDMKLSKYITDRPKECFKVLKECLIYFSKHYQPSPELESFNLYNDFHKTETIKLPLSISEAFKKYSYEDFKNLLNTIGLKDIKEAYISFKRPYQKPKNKSKLNKEGKELLERTLNWFDGKITKISLEDQRSLIKMYIKKLGTGSYKELFKREANKYNPNAVEFLTKVLPDPDHYNRDKRVYKKYKDVN